MNQELGKEGEKIAAQYIEKMGYQILEKNYRCKMGEIDLIAIDKEELVFIEVKTRGQKKFGTPGEAVNHQKKNHIYHVAEYFLMVNQIESCYSRIDVIEIYMTKQTYSINYIKNSILDRPTRKRKKDDENEDNNGEEIYM